MNRWLQTKQYTCPACGARYVHDRGYAHAGFECRFRLAPTNRQHNGNVLTRLPTARGRATADLDPIGLAAVLPNDAHS